MNRLRIPWPVIALIIALLSNNVLIGATESVQETRSTRSLPLLKTFSFTSHWSGNEKAGIYPTGEGMGAMGKLLGLMEDCLVLKDPQIQRTGGTASNPSHVLQTSFTNTEGHHELMFISLPENERTGTGEGRISMIYSLEPGPDPIQPVKEEIYLPLSDLLGMSSPDFWMVSDRTKRVEEISIENLDATLRRRLLRLTRHFMRRKRQRTRTISESELDP